MATRLKLLLMNGRQSVMIAPSPPMMKMGFPFGLLPSALCLFYLEGREQKEKSIVIGLQTNPKIVGRRRRKLDFTI
jgi:hypothetical protein